MLIQLALCTDMAGQLINMISNTQYAVPATLPSAPTPATSLLPSTPSPFIPLSMDPALTTPFTVVPPSQADHPLMHIARVWTRARVRVKRANLSVNPRGPISLFVPGGLTLDGWVQHMYNNFLFDIPHPGAQGRLYLITCGWRVGVFPNWYACTINCD
jgi:hypothetical protein